MSAQESPPVGEIEEVFQEDDEAVFPAAVVAVAVEGPVGVHILPSVSGGMRGFLLDAGNGLTKKIAGPDRRRRKLSIWADQPFYIGGSQQEAAAGVGARIPANLVVDMTHCDEVWATITVAGTVSFIVENWAS
jgi:hypothetical protein